MTDKNEILREVAAVRRDLEKLESEISTANGAMPKNNDPAEGGVRNFQLVLRRLESIEELAGDTAEKLRSILKRTDR